MNTKFDTKTIISLAAALILLVVGIVLTINANNAPTTIEEEVTYLTYDVKGVIDYHQAYGKSTRWKNEPSLIYFSEIIDSILVSYNYKFLPSKPVSRINGQVEISGVLTSPGMWKKEVPILLPTLELWEISAPPSY